MKQTIRVMVLVFGLAGLCMFFLVGGSLSQTTGPGDAFYRKGKALANAWRCHEAIAEFGKAIEANPNDPRYYTARAECRGVRMSANANTAANISIEEERQNSAKANAVSDADIAAALRLDPNHGRAYFVRASAHAKMHGYLLLPEEPEVTLRDPAAILSDFDRAIELEPKNAEFYIERGSFYLGKLEDQERGLKDYAIAIRLQPRNIDYLERRARHYSWNGPCEKGLADWTKILTLDRRHPVAREFRAECYLELGQHVSALSDVNSEMRIEPLKEASLLELRARVYRAMGKIALAQADERRVERLRQEEKRYLRELMKESRR